MVIELTRKGLFEEMIDAGEKGGECLTGTGRRGNQNICPRLNNRPSLSLDIGGGTDRRFKPFSDERMKSRKRHATECYHARMTVLHYGCPG
jgi:hypothetical protein